MKKHISWPFVAHTCNTSCLGGRDQKDHGSRPAQAKKFVGHHLNGKKAEHVIPMMAGNIK
jgi:hypothetical protein